MQIRRLKHLGQAVLPDAARAAASDFVAPIAGSVVGGALGARGPVRAPIGVPVGVADGAARLWAGRGEGQAAAKVMENLIATRGASDLPAIFKPPA
jgi:hypothetical protein